MKYIKKFEGYKQKNINTLSVMTSGEYYDVEYELDRGSYGDRDTPEVPMSVELLSVQQNDEEVLKELSVSTIEEIEEYILDFER